MKNKDWKMKNIQKCSKNKNYQQIKKIMKNNKLTY